MTSQATIDLRRAEGVCVICGGPLDQRTRSKCYDCRQKNNARCRRMFERRAVKGLCVQCAKPMDRSVEPGSAVRCHDCLKGTQRRALGYRKERVARGECPCGAGAALYGRLCLDCWFMMVTRSATGSTAIWRQVKALFIVGQGTRCAYTGEWLTPGVNASLDHIVPVSRGGASDIMNLQWVTELVNRMKTDMTHDEFIASCHVISGRYSGNTASPPSVST